MNTESSDKSKYLNEYTIEQATRGGNSCYGIT